MIAGFLADTCKVGQGAACCRYVTMSAGGWECGKADPAIRHAIDQRAGSMKAKGDNCPGVTNLAELGRGLDVLADSVKFMEVGDEQG